MKKKQVFGNGCGFWVYEKKVSYFFSPKFLFVLVMLNNA